jgi:hypothetical protein
MDRANIDELFKWITRPVKTIAHGSVALPKPAAAAAAASD